MKLILIPIFLLSLSVNAFATQISGGNKEKSMCVYIDHIGGNPVFTVDKDGKIHKPPAASILEPSVDYYMLSASKCSGQKIPLFCKREESEYFALFKNIPIGTRDKKIKLFYQTDEINKCVFVTRYEDIK